jgi:hypothetical protein
MDLSREDAFRINVLLANKPLAIKINESSMTLYGLTASGEAQVKLNPECRDEKYVKKIKEVLSAHVTGSPGGYPVFLQRWTRMGQMRDTSLEQLLLLGEPEAIVAAVCATGMTDELARRAWWAMEEAENARRLLQHEAVVSGQMGPVLARYLLEHLPFETEPEKMIESVRQMVKPGLLDDKQHADLWKKGLRKPAYLVGFTLTIPDQLPIDVKAHGLYPDLHPGLSELAEQGNALAAFFEKLLSGQGQAFLSAIETILKKPSNQDVVNISFDAVRDYFSPLRPEGDPDQPLDELVSDAEKFVETCDDCQALVNMNDQLAALLNSARVLSGLGYGVLRPVFHDTTAIGSLMRRKLEPVFSPLQEHFDRLAGRH